jgi:hypothetical protein
MKESSVRNDSCYKGLDKVKYHGFTVVSEGIVLDTTTIVPQAARK